MKKLILFLFMLIIVPVHSAQVANVEYVHKVIEQKWDITVPYNPLLVSTQQIANMKYLLTAVDVANEMLNGEATTDYGNGEFATMVAADTVATDTAVETLIQKNETKEYKFFVTTTPDTSSFDFSISAAGEFYIDWGDGKTETITRTNTNNTPYTHTYDTAGTYVISFGGKATGYKHDGTEYSDAAISFAVNPNVGGISGSLGEIFSTLEDGTQPCFFNLFAGCSGLTGQIPGNLFSGVSGPPVIAMFRQVFYNCTELTGPIPENLFGGIYGQPARAMFDKAFMHCRGLTSIPEKLFGDITGDPAVRMFSYTFAYCSGLTGPSARISGKYIYEIWPSGVGSENMYKDASGLSDYSNIPQDYKDF